MENNNTSTSTNKSSMTNQRKVLLNRISVCSFVLVDLAEYLDTHNSDQEALAHYKKHLAMLKEAHEAYVNAYGPLKHGDLAETATCWTWTDDPWPWE